MVQPTPRAGDAPPAVRVSRTIKASRQRVFRAWTDPELLMRWFVEPGGDMQVRELDLRTGGRYMLEGRERGMTWRIEGRYLEVEPPSKLVYTWTWDNDPGLGDKAGRDTLVTVEFLEHGAETELVVTHERLATERARADHGAGWIGCLERFGSLVEKE
jgi:uncharacterized protein YndB with AHSA1/START domain